MSQSPDQLDPKLVAEADTDLGPLWVDKQADVVSPDLIERGEWQPDITGLMRRTLRPGMTFVDAGANIGYFSVLGARLVGPEGRVVAIEPDPGNLRILNANLSRHGCANTTVHPVAAWFERTDLTLTRYVGGATAQVGRDEGGPQVEAAPLDDLVAGPVDYLKIDCENTDHVVARGAADLLRDNPSMLVTVEFHPRHASHTGDSPSAILDQYREMGLTPYEISDKGRGLVATTYERLANLDLPEEHVSFDFAMSRNLPKRLIARWPWWRTPAYRKGKGMLERGGDMLEYVPARIRPRIRRRDRKPAGRNS
jgi:FkbM family methyltransferase